MTKFIFEMSENFAKGLNKLVTACDSCFALKESKYQMTHMTLVRTVRL